MITLYCFVSPHPKAKAAVEAYAPEAVFTDTSADRWEYWRILSSYWTGEHDLMTIEQDNEITAEVVPSFEACPEPWCSYQYRGAGVFQAPVMTESLGCTRFRKELQQAVPIEEIGGSTLTQWPGHKVASDPVRVPWDRIDMRIKEHLRANGFKVHVHGEVRHFHAYPDHAVNARVQKAVDDFMFACRVNMDRSMKYLTLRAVSDALVLARSGELNANPDTR